MKKAPVGVNVQESKAEDALAGTLVDIGHPRYVWLVELTTKSWTLVRKEELGDALCDARFLASLMME